MEDVASDRVRRKSPQSGLLFCEKKENGVREIEDFILFFFGKNGTLSPYIDLQSHRCRGKSDF